MPDLTIRNVSKDVHKLLLESAKVHNRSLNKEIVSILTSEADLTVRGLEFVRVFPKGQQLARGGEKRSKTPRLKIVPSRRGI
jgi:plasmid stability protein